MYNLNNLHMLKFKRLKWQVNILLEYDIENIIKIVFPLKVGLAVQTSIPDLTYSLVLLVLVSILLLFLPFDTS